MRTDRTRSSPPGRRGDRGYLMVLLVIIVAFVGVVAAMQVLVLTSVATTSRAYDSYRQGATEMTRLERVVAEALIDVRQTCVPGPMPTLDEAVNARLASLSLGGATVTPTGIPSTIPTIVTFPSATAAPDSLVSIADDVQPLLTAELAQLVGPRAAVYPTLQFSFASERVVLDASRTYMTQVTARLIAAPLTRFPIAAYDLPSEIGSTTGVRSAAPESSLPSGLVPGRDLAFVADLQSRAGVLPYAYRRRAALAAAYQYVFSQYFIDRVAEYAGVTHYRDLAGGPGTATLAGMTQVGTNTTWDLGVAGQGTFGTVTLSNDAFVVLSEQPGATLHLQDSVGSAASTPVLLLLFGPADPAMAPLVVDIATIARPVLIIGYHVRITAARGTAVNGGLMLDPASSMMPTGPLTLGHLSYWAGSTEIPPNAVVTGPMPIAAEAMAPRVVFVATKSTRL